MAGERKRLKEYLFENDLGMRILIGFICWICLALFLNFRETKIEVFELNAKAGKYVVAQVDFEFPDEEATIVLRQEAIRDLGYIYQIEPHQLRQVRLDFENYIHSQEWKRKVPQASYEDMYFIADVLENVLLNLRFADAKTINHIKQLGLSVDNYLVFSANTKQEKPKLTGNYWKLLREVAFTKVLSSKLPKVDKRSIEFVITFFGQRQLDLQRDHNEENNIREMVEASVPQKYTRVKAGSRLIGQGERVTPRHIAMMQAMKEAIRDSRQIWQPITIIGNFLLAFVFISLSVLYFRIDQKEILKSLQKLSLIVCIVILTLAFAKVAEYVLLQRTINLLDSVNYPLLVPFGAILLSILLNSRIALYGSFFLSIILAITLAVNHNQFLIINLVTSLVVVVTTKSLRKRTEVFVVCAKSFVAALLVILALKFVANNYWSLSLAGDILSSFLFMTMIAILVVGLLPILEALFNVMTDITLMEYMDPNNELLRRLTLEAPGTYQHSLVMGNLTETAAQAIGANGLFCRVATLYHDIGKLNNAHYFTENQQTGINIHQLLTPAESAKVIISHVKDGEVLARKYRLPQPFIDIIRQHHGTTLVYYFYRREVELKGGDASQVDEGLFRYPGPKPRSREAVIMMITDGVEAASRSLDEISEESLTNMVNKVVKDKEDDGQFDESCLTFEELQVVKRVLIKTLLVTRHVRIKYPEKRE